MMDQHHCLQSDPQPDATRRRQNHDPVWHLSFKGVLDHVVASHESFRAHAGRPRNQAAARAHLIVVCATKKLDLRPFRSEPRALKKRTKSYQLLTDPRATFQEIPHRSGYKKCA